ncbi:hypothetical protein DFJ74DRAFT_659430 [Hyaloraphidium curvatum]|nr:hypothetical protein DFJ74DRAFT_659430 [Hyaloraphidium curvatum]
MDSSLRLLSETNASVIMDSGPRDRPPELDGNGSGAFAASGPVPPGAGAQIGPDQGVGLVLESPTTAFVPTIEVRLDGGPKRKSLPVERTEPQPLDAMAPPTARPKKSRKSKKRESRERWETDGQHQQAPFASYLPDERRAGGRFAVYDSYDPMGAPTDAFANPTMPVPLVNGFPMQMPAFQMPFVSPFGQMTLDQAAQFFPWSYNSEGEQRYHEELYHNSLLLESGVSYVLHFSIGLLGGASLLSMLVLPLVVPSNTNTSNGMTSLQVFFAYFSPYALQFSRLFSFLATIALVAVLDIMIGAHAWTKPKTSEVPSQATNHRPASGRPQNELPLGNGEHPVPHRKSSARWVVQCAMCISSITCFLTSIFCTPIDDSLYFSDQGTGTGRYGASGW